MKFLTLMATFVLASSTAFAGQERGGGDLCEDRIKIIRDDISSWITKGGSSGLELPHGVSVTTYNQQMRTAISSAQIECVGSGDRDYPVQINGISKVCRFDNEVSSSKKITCDFTKFQSMNESDQYILVHHEFAGLADIEIPNAADSNYQISNQISGYLANEVVKKLVVKPSSNSAAVPHASVVCIATPQYESEFGSQYWYAANCTAPAPKYIAQTSLALFGYIPQNKKDQMKAVVATRIAQFGAREVISFDRYDIYANADLSVASNICVFSGESSLKDVICKIKPVLSGNLMNQNQSVNQVLLANSFKLIGQMQQNDIGDQRAPLQIYVK